MRASDWCGSATRVVFGSTGAATQRLGDLDGVLRSAIPLSRRVGFVSVAGGSGTTSTTVSIASLLARRRSSMVLGVDTVGGAAGMRSQTLGSSDHTDHTDPNARSDHTAAEARDRRHAARRAADARDGLERTASGLYLLDVCARPGATRPGPATVTEWAEETGPIARFFDLVLTDWGVRSAAPELDVLAATSHVLVVVSRADRHAATTAASTVAALRDSGGSPRTLLALVDVGRTPDRMVAGLRRELGTGVHLIPEEPARSRRSAQGSRAFGGPTRNAHLRLAAEVVSAAVTSQTSTARRQAVPLRGVSA